MLISHLPHVYITILIFLLKVNISVEQSYSYYVGATDELQVIMLMCSLAFPFEFDASSLIHRVCLMFEGFWSLRFSTKWHTHNTIRREGIYNLLSVDNTFLLRIWIAYMTRQWLFVSCCRFRAQYLKDHSMMKFIRHLVHGYIRYVYREITKRIGISCSSRNLSYIVDTFFFFISPKEGYIQQKKI